MRDGLRAYIAALRQVDVSPVETAQSIVEVCAKTVVMAARGAALAPRFGSVRGIPLIGRGVRLRGVRRVHAGRRLRIEDYAEVQGTSAQSVLLGDNVTIGPFASIRPSNYYGRLLGVGLRVGSGSSLGAYCYIGCAGGVTIGRDVMMAPGVMIFAENHVFDSTDRTIKSQGVSFAPVVIEDNCWLASGVIITGGITVGRGAVIGAGAVVTRNVEPGEIVVGNPAKPMRSRLGDTSSQTP